MKQNTELPEILKQLFLSIYPIEEIVLKEIASVLKYKTINRKELLLKEGQVCKYIFFVEKGLLRSYYYDEENEVTTWFMKENDFVISVKSFYLQEKSTEYIQALEECYLYYISYEELNNLYLKYHSFCIIGTFLTQQYYIRSEDRLLNLRQKSALIRYKFLIKNHPDIINRCTNKIIASYLKISKETLSRIRALKN
ncbi:MAG: Crp/Fnr family transcriptional regulator [Bacteroidetes bacterium]|nr:Crp/Fnr family transcriptional regulator [Bacteroidota bacterium]MBS1649874.1 Crp/Fnr family transcriptional regulator [Bacteroidota bacterium]